MDNHEYNEGNMRGQEPDTGNQEGGRRNNGKNRFWAGVLAGALVTALAGLMVVGMSAGIYIFGKKVMSRQPGTQTEGRAPAISDGSKEPEGVNFDRVKIGRAHV